MSVHIIDDLNFTCRTCLGRRENMQSLFHKTVTTVSVLEMFEQSTKITISVDDDLPKRICDACFEELAVTYKFIEKSKKSDIYLRKLFDDSFIKEIKLEINTEGVEDREDKSYAFGQDKKIKKLTKRLSTSKNNSKIKSKQKPDNSDKDFSDYSIDDSILSYDTCKIQSVEKPIAKIKHRSKSRCLENKKINKGPSQCSICGLTAQSFSALIIHKRTHTGEKPYKCSTCGRTFSQKSSLKIHMSRIHPSKRFNVRREHTCEICGKAFTSSNNLKIHFRIHTGEKPYECAICSKRFMQLGSLIGHKRRHTGEKPYVCQICFKGFVELNHLKRHQSVHSEDKPFICNVCGKAVKSTFALKQHSKLHTNEKEYTCDQCGTSFLIKGNLDAHKRVIHSERSGQCAICRKIYSNLAEHMVKHTGEKPYECGICKKRFSHRRGLNMHNRQHTFANKFKCNVEGCNQSFNAQWVLECHIMKHTGHTPYMCRFCSRGFLRACHLTKHLKINHPNESKDLPNDETNINESILPIYV